MKPERSNKPCFDNWGDKRIIGGHEIVADVDSWVGGLVRYGESWSLLSFDADEEQLTCQSGRVVLQHNGAPSLPLIPPFKDQPFSAWDALQMLGYTTELRADGALTIVCGAGHIIVERTDHGTIRVKGYERLGGIIPPSAVRQTAKEIQGVYVPVLEYLGLWTKE